MSQKSENKRPLVRIAYSQLGGADVDRLVDNLLDYVEDQVSTPDEVLAKSKSKELKTLVENLPNQDIKFTNKEIHEIEEKYAMNLWKSKSEIIDRELLESITINYNRSKTLILI